MQPDVWLTIDRISKVKRKRWPGKSKRDFINLAQETFGGRDDLSRAEVSRLALILEASEQWPGKARVDVVHQSVDPSKLTHHADSTPDWLLDGISMLVETQEGSSVLDLFCGNGRLAAYLPPDALYEGHDNNAGRVLEAVQAFRHHIIEPTDLTTWLVGDPQSKYSLVFVHGPETYVHVDYPCIASQKPGRLNFHEAMVEVGARCVTHGGFLVSVIGKPDFTYSHFEEPLYTLLDEDGIVLVDANIREGTTSWHICIYRKGVRRGKPQQNLVFNNPDEFIEWCLTEDAPKLKVPVCTEDPRPMTVKQWDIQVAPVVTVGQPKYSSKPVTELFRSKGSKIGIRWANPVHALSWAIHQALYSPRPWHMDVRLFVERLPFFNYLQLRAQAVTPNQVLNLPNALPVVEEPALTAHLDKKVRAMKRTQLPYPERTTMENRYLTLGPGARLVLKDDVGVVTKRYTVKFSETDFVNRKYPRLHLEEQP